MARKFAELSKELRSAPGASEAIDAHKRALLAEMRLWALREHAGLTQEQLAAALEVSQSNVSRIERGNDAYLSTLERYVEALGGKLEVRAVFRDQVVPLSLSRDE